MNPSPYEPPLHPSELKRTTRMRSLFRFIMFFFIGVAATLGWQAYGSLARERMATWSPRLAWLAPPAALTGGDQIVAISRDLAVVRQSVDKLAAGITKLQASQPGTDGSSASSVPARKPASRAR
jgi:hypothetical protein